MTAILASQLTENHYNRTVVFLSQAKLRAWPRYREVTGEYSLDMTTKQTRKHGPHTFTIKSVTHKTNGQTSIKFYGIPNNFLCAPTCEIEFAK